MSELAKSLGSEDADFFKARGFGGRLSFGRKPALLVIDLSKGFTDPVQPLGSDLSGQIAATNVLIRAARTQRVPVIFSAVRYEGRNLRDAGLWYQKMRGQSTLHIDGDGHELDPRLLREEGDEVLYKKYASCFFGSDLTSRLVNEGIDTLIITGTSTSGCVRATVVDAVQLGFRPMVVAEGVGDRSHASHQQSLFDIDTKYGDVVGLSEAQAYLTALPAT
ncbi:isochorismatase family protein [Hydrogenophaga sp. BPS33]|uniref:isochorismatase family protein n=1 Tax=Hydrogenophaga sp. BPS33 TaxID=2651974 RepID=UPI001F1BC9CF|nr:isochorismatase family protein [Hydrogenophaga sp. BPS33]